MAPKRRRSSAGEHLPLPVSKKTRTRHPPDLLSDLSDELLIRILHKLPISTLLQCQRLSHRFYTLAGDSQIWKNLYYNRFVLPRALRIPGIRAAQPDDALHFSSKRSKWLDEDTLVNRVDGKVTNWKKQYKLRHNWSIGACEVQEIHVADRPSEPGMLVRLADGVVVTADKEEGLRAWNLKGKELIAKCELDGDAVPTCLAVDEQESGEKGLGIAVGFMDGGWGTWRLDIQLMAFTQPFRHPPSSNGTLGAVAYAHPYILTSTDSQLLSLYSFNPTRATNSSPSPPKNDTYPPSSTPAEVTACSTPITDSPKPHLLASLKSYTSWPPLSLSIRSTSTTLIASIAYSLPTYLSGYTIGLQELHLSLSSGLITFSRLASSLPQGFNSLLTQTTSPPSSSTTSPPPPNASARAVGVRGLGAGVNTRPTSLSYSHPYILATHPDNTLTLYLCTSDPSTLSLSPGTKLWGHTSSVSSAEITPRGKAVSVSTRGNELRVWELEGGFTNSSFGSSSRRRLKNRTRRAAVDVGLERSVRIRASEPEVADERGGMLDMDTRAFEEDIHARKQWVGFDDEVVIVLKESARGSQALMVYDFT